MRGDPITQLKAKLSQEKGAIPKEWGGRLTVALAYPNLYRLGMSNLGFQRVYGLLNARPDVVAERVFLPDPQEMSLYLQAGRPLLSMESQSPVERFHLLAFSLSFENDIPNLLTMLSLARLPLLSAERSEAHPLVMAGGVATFLNPEPVAPFMDLFLLGEAEVALEGFISLLKEAQSRLPPRKALLYTLASSLPHVYVPSLYEPLYHPDGTLKSFEPKAPGIPEKVQVPRAVLDGSAKLGPASSIVLTPETEFGQKVLVETERGCGRGCRFCAAGHVYRPPRQWSGASLEAAVEEALMRSEEVGLVGAALGDLPSLQGLTARIVSRGGRFSLSSLRVDGLSRALLENLEAAGQKTVTVAPEAGSERLRRVINKHLTREEILRAVDLVAETGPFSLRLYFLIGLPTETSEDIRELMALAKAIRHRMVKKGAPRGRVGRIRLSINCFIPKPFTPFQWVPMEEVSSLKEKQKNIRRALSQEGGIQVTIDVPKWAYVQTLLSVGDRRVAPMLLLNHRHAGNWTKAFRFSKTNPDFFVYRPKRPEELLPWDFVDHGIHKTHLLREYALALEGKESEPCRVGLCYRCGVCHPDSQAPA